MKYFFLPLILILMSCSLDKNSAYWNEDSINKFSDNKKLSKILSTTKNFKEMTFEEFEIFLKDYTEKAEYPDINK
ncbi:hypothetical protein ABXT47_03125 [Candidatus Pelagibacter sp. Uisw_099_02]|uniref:hypothetical protein n=1 Tax=Candidatus Pelagibacter sp. Uisw_099_02 TaxID=3230981 RepID=UPI0039E865F0|tara:strand:- start:413 stop:637 length:225 start_codon:yes stop_codon:yes gene_type:complete